MSLLEETRRPKIKIQYLHGKHYIWDCNDAQQLRKENRILGSFVGPMPGQVNQVNEKGLPLELMPEEAKILVESNICEIVEYQKSDLCKFKEPYEKYRESLQQDYNALQKKGRQAEIISYKNMMTTKRLKLNQESSLNEEILEMETNQPTCISINSIPIEFSTKSQWTASLVKSDWSYPISDREKIRYTVFKDMWNRGHYISNGLRFGCDFLVYQCDPVKIHAKYMVICKSFDQEISSLQLLILGRLSTQVNKKLLIACVDKDLKAKYICLRWSGNQDSIFNRFKDLNLRFKD